MTTESDINAAILLQTEPEDEVLWARYNGMGRFYEFRINQNYFTIPEEDLHEVGDIIFHVENVIEYRKAKSLGQSIDDYWLRNHATRTPFAWLSD